MSAATGTAAASSNVRFDGFRATPIRTQTYSANDPSSSSSGFATSWSPRTSGAPYLSRTTAFIPVARSVAVAVMSMDLLLGRLREAGFSAEATFAAYHVLDGHIFGFSLWETSHTYLHEHAQQHFSEGQHRNVSAFELALDLIVDGLKKIRDTA